MSENWTVIEQVGPVTRYGSECGDADGCDVADREGVGYNDGDRDAWDAAICQAAGCDGGDCDVCGVVGCDIAACDGGGREDRGVSVSSAAGYDGGLYAMVKQGVVVGAAACTGPTEAPAPADLGNGRTGVRGVTHTTSLE